MLHTPADFPHPGSDAFLAPAGDPVRIIQRCADSRLIVALTDARYPAERASGTRTVDAAQVHATRELAVGAPTKRRGRGRR